MPYVDALERYAAEQRLWFTIPSHRAAARSHLTSRLGYRASSLDLPALLPGVDVGPKPTALDQARRRAADIWGAAETWFLTNGASEGNRAACLAIRTFGETVVLQRDVHTSTIDGIVLAGLRPVFVPPEIDGRLGVSVGMSAVALADVLAREREVAAVLAVSPTYFGAVNDLAKLSQLAHSRGVPFVVDEAWGSHFRFSSSAPADALSVGADLVVSSTHKMGGSLTQTAMLHLGRGVHASALKRPLEKALRTLQTTSPSALLLASLDAAQAFWASEDASILDKSISFARYIREQLEAGAVPGARSGDRYLTGHSSVMDCDPLHVVVALENDDIDGRAVERLLSSHRLAELEASTRRCLLLIISPFGERGVSTADLLLGALRHALNLPGSRSPRRSDSAIPPPSSLPEALLTPRAAFFSESRTVPIQQAAGAISAATVSAYPPGTPILVPGEVITHEVVSFLLASVHDGGRLRGATPDTLSIVDGRVPVEWSDNTSQ